MGKVDLKKWLESLKPLQINSYNQDFLLTWEKSLDDIKATILTAEAFKALHQAGVGYEIFQNGLGIGIFRDHSTRTRFSFASAVDSLGLSFAELDEKKSQIAHGETVRETANMISFLTQVIGIRDDMYLGEGDSYMREVGQAVRAGHQEGVLHQKPTIVNLQSDIDHPTQAVSDLAKLRDYFGSFDNLKGRKIAMTWAYSPSYGKPLSVPQGVIGLMTRLGMDVHLAHPEGYELLPEIVELAGENARKSGGSFVAGNDMDAAFKDADVVYPKSWAPFTVMEQRTELLKNQDAPGLEALEKTCLKENAKYVDWECNAEKMRLTKEGKALYQHCLPADITDVSCEKGEVSKEVFERYRIHTYQQAGYKPFVIAAMIFLAREKVPIEKLVSFL
ncbi:knotted carbamoyltransferase YgeW [bacterium]|nr:knotted carbamoyltransferase YgeW [bacterium]